MVFESLVSDLLNRFIGDYVENLDKSQLKIGIWGGKISSYEFDVPFKVKAGQIGKLTLKIPWKNLYNDAVVATLDGLYLLVVPGATIKFDAAKEERYQQEAKQRELQRIEEALQMAAHLLFSLESVVYKEPHNVCSGPGLIESWFHLSFNSFLLFVFSEKPQEDKKDTFMEKLATQVIKNLQVKISSIHLRYEDDTADENWKSCILNEAAKIIYKVTDVSDRLSIFMLHLLILLFVVFKPIFASAKMIINPNAELELKSPKADLHLEVQNIAIEMTKPQYLTMVELLESIDCMVKNAPYRKFRPDVCIQSSARLWWKYAFNSIMEVHIRRFSHMWSWSNIRQHRENLKAYRTAYKTKLLSQNKPNQDTERHVQELEKVLDVFNITLARQQAQMEFNYRSSSSSRCTGLDRRWWGRRRRGDRSSGLEDLMTAEEKEKLYTAIGYSGSSHNLALPKQYVAVVVTFQLFRTSVTIREQPDVPEILKVQMIDLSTRISQRPGAQAFRVEAALQHWYVTGLLQQGAVPSLIASVGDASSSLLSVLFELNPEETAADQLLRVHSQPVEIIYDALTVNSLAEFFKTGKGVDLEVLTSATLSKLEEIKEKTATGLSHIIETRKVLDLRIDLKPSYLLVPKCGFYSNTSDLIIVDFGSLQLNSVEQSSLSSSSSSFSSLEEIMDRAYERYNVELRRVQVLYSKSGEAWKSARLQGSSVQHILQPMDFTVQLAKCMVEKDARMPRFKVSGELPLLHIKISDQKIQNILDLVDSIPLPNMGSSPSTPTKKVDLVQPDTTVATPTEINTPFRSEKSIDEDHQLSALEELTDLHFKFEVKEVLLELTRQVDQEKTILSFSVRQLGAEGKRRSFDMSVTSYLRRVTLSYCDIPDGMNRPLHLISSSEQQGSNLLKVEFIKVSTVQSLKAVQSTVHRVEFSSLDFLLHTKALLSTITYLTGVVPPKLSAALSLTNVSDLSPVSKLAKDSSVFSFKLFAMLGCFHVEVCDDRHSIADIRVQGIDASVLVQAKETEVFARLREIVVTDVNPKTIHRKAVSIMGEEVFSFKLCLFPGATEGEGYSDMSKVDGKVTLRLGCIQIIYLHKFLMSLLMFIDNFQTAKEALSAATAQAAEKAASSVRGFAQKSFRLSMDIKLKAPLIIIPQSSTSHNAMVVDLGLITVGNSFSLLQVEGFSLPAVVEKMDVKLTQLKLSRTTLKPDSSQPDISILQPINLELLIIRNLAALWFTEIAGVQVQGVLRSLTMSLGEEDLSVLMKILLENVGEGSKEHSMDVRRQVAQGNPTLGLTENTINILLNFEIKEVLLTLKKPREQKESPFLVFQVAQLGIDTKVRKYDMCATTYINKITMKCLEFKGQSPSADRLGPNFSTIYKNTEQMINAISIVGDEVFSFTMSLTPNATEGAGYTDTSKTDGRVKLSVGCIQVVYLHKFIMSLLNFTNNFQTAKEALGSATAQAAEKAASSVRDFARKSFRLSMDIKLKAPLIIIPQSSTSHNALVMDLGLITVGNSFSLLPVDGCPLPAVIDSVNVQLTHLKLSRTCGDWTSGQPSTELLEPVNLRLNIKRNLAASWFKKMVAIEIDGDLKPMKVGGGGGAPVLMAVSFQPGSVLLFFRISDVGKPTAISEEEEDGALETMKFNFNIESLGLVLYSNDPIQPSDLQHQENLRLGEFTLHLLKTSGRILTNGNMEVTTILTACTLDDLRMGMERVTSRMVGRRDEQSSEAMIDLTYRQSAGEREVVAVLQKLNVCASVEFLMAVTDFFLQALPQSSYPTTATSDRLPLRQTAEPRASAKTAVVVDPEVVFVASLMKADAPALVASFQCDFTLQIDDDGSQNMRANLREFKVLACPFIRDKEAKAVTTVLRPCSVALETKTQPNQPLKGSMTVEEVIISPFILNTVMTITAAMTTKQSDEQTQESKSKVNDLWSVMNIYSCNFWFLGVDQAAEATESFREPDGCNQGESFAAEVVQLTLESGLGHRTVPLLLAESSFNGSAKNWSSLLQLRADMTLEVNYFNEIHAVWEPLIERVDSGRRRWNLELEMKNNPVQDKSPIHGDDFVILPEPRTAINICSKDTMNITVSQCSLNVLHNLAKAFSEGTASTFDYSLKEKAPFTIRNTLGIPLIVQHSANLRQVGPSCLFNLTIGQNAALSLLSHPVTCRRNRQVTDLIFPSGYSEISNIAVDKPGRRLYNIRGPMLQEAVSVLLQIDAADGNKVITVRSPLQIKNHFSVPFTIMKYCPTSRSLQSVGQAEPEREFHIALETYRCQLFVRPAGCLDGQYGPSSTCVAWKEQVHRSSEVSSVLQCPAVDSSLLPLMVSTLAVPDDLRHIASHGEEDWDPAYIIHLHPVATLRNLLPYTVRYMMESSADSYELQEGSTSDLLNARVSGEIMSLVLMRYQGRDWHGHIRIEKESPEFFAVCLTCDSDTSMTLDVSVHVTRTASRLLLSLFSPYWIINKTSRVLQYRAEDVNVKHPADCRDIILFSFRKKNLFSKSKLQLCVSTSSWSDAFSLDTVGSYGCVRCPANNMDFLVGVSIQMSSFNLTRIVTMSPFYNLVNKSSYELEVGEVTSQTSTRWHYIASTECLPLWPENPSGKLCVRVVGSESTSKFFFFNCQDNGTLLSLDMCGGIIVDVNISDLSTVIGFTDYYEGAAPALLLNHTPWVTISYKQSGSAAVHQLNPGEARLFAWDDPASVRALSWSCMEHSAELDLLKDQVGQFSYDSLSQVHWVSFLDGRQRVLLFTEDVAVVTKARQAEELEQFQQEVKVSLQNLGLSLINNTGRQEIAYIGITSSGVVWEMKPKNRWKPFSQKNINLLEKTYQSQLSGKTEGGWVKLETNLEVNLSGATMMMRQPYSCPVRRNFLSGIQVEFKQSLHQRSLRAQLYWLQVDNQLPGAIFPIVFHPVPPPKSIALDSEPKPFIDVSIITRFNQHSSVMQFKYFMALVQEMAVKIDQGFLGAILALFTPAADTQADRQKVEQDSDLQLLQTELMEASLTDTSGLSFFEHFHISPIKLHLSLSLGSSGDDSAQEVAAIQSLNLLLKSIGATLTDVDDLIFKLAFFEVKYQFYRREKLMWAVVRHYTEQFLKQMYVLVLGLDVLGNPFGLIRGLSEGVEAFFYEPFQGAVQGPEEFAEGFVIGVRSLLGHTVGGAAGMVSRITGSVGKGLAAITMDKEYQQKRREEMNRPPKDFGESLAKGGKGLLKGVVGGVTGIVTKPVEGAKKEGAAGFFKGIGKGLVGVVARPTGGIVDMASSTFQGIQRAAESTEEVTKLRPVRLIREDGIIRPYDLTESQGFDLFQIKQLEGEVFRDHVQYPGHRKTNIIVTNRRVLCVKEIDFVGHFNKEWECLFENFSRPAAVSGSELKIFSKVRTHQTANRAFVRRERSC
uniref:Vacuolar protein sorting 13 homolog C n=1 Tax=Sparus aurata TaxID=8175 RepID=A0A671VLI5_SPAAU